MEARLLGSGQDQRYCGEPARTPSKLDSIALAHLQANESLGKAVVRIEDILRRLGHHEPNGANAKAPTEAPTSSGFTHSMLGSLNQQGALSARLHGLLDVLEQYV